MTGQIALSIKVTGQQILGQKLNTENQVLHQSGECSCSLVVFI